MNISSQIDNILVALSGGVDSSVAIALLKEQDKNIMGMNMRLFDKSIASNCNCDSNIKDAESVCRKLNIPFQVVNLSTEFTKKVIVPFISSYENGLTPNPCIYCNFNLKFNALYEKANELGFEYLATGHYARIEYDENVDRFLLKKALDLSKDQSYVLYTLSKEQLGHILFPLGDLSKSTVRTIAKKYNFDNADKHESQDICFIPNGKYAEFIKDFTKKDYPAGHFIDEDGNILGIHKGIINYTVGQRKGLGLALKRPMYVKTVDPINNNIILAPNDNLFSREFDVENINWLAIDRPSSPIHAKVKIRYHHKEANAIIKPTSNDSAKIIFDEPERAITKGQSAVFYHGDIVLGGGTIIKVYNN